MNLGGKSNPEYMAVLTEVVHCLRNQMHHPKLTMDARQITDWFHHVSEEEVGEVLLRMETESRNGWRTAKSQPHG